MCYVILYDANQIVDPDADTLELHPSLRRGEPVQEAQRG
jgi:hypothetical protein